MDKNDTQPIRERGSRDLSLLLGGNETGRKTPKR